MDWNTWGPPLVVLTLGVATGLGLALGAGGQRASGDAVQARREDLVAKKGQLLEQLRLLEADRDKLGEAGFASRKEELVAQAAATLASLDALDAGPPPEELVAPVASGDPGRRMFTTGLWTGGVLLFFGLLSVFLSSQSSERAAGGSMTGGGPVMPQVSDEVAAAKARLEADPNDKEALHIVTYEALLQRDLDNAMQLVERARVLDPEAPELSVHFAILQLSVGMLDKADASLAKAIAARPEWGRPRLWLGLVRMYQKRTDESIVEVEKAIGLGLRPDEARFASGLLADARNPQPAAAPAAAQASGSGPMYSGPGGGAVQLAGTVEAPPGTPPDPNTVVFLMVYNNAAGGPPPVATARLTVADLPYTFRFEEGHAMTGGPWPSEVWIRARIDADGRPGSGPGDMDSALLGPIVPGTTGIALSFSP